MARGALGSHAKLRVIRALGEDVDSNECLSERRKGGDQWVRYNDGRPRSCLQAHFNINVPDAMMDSRAAAVASKLISISMGQIHDGRPRSRSCLYSLFDISGPDTMTDGRAVAAASTALSISVGQIQ